MTEEIKKKRICHLVWLIAAIIALLLTGKRGHIIFTAAALVFLFYFYMSNHKRGRIIKILFALSLVIMLVFVVSMFVPYILLFLERFVEQAQLGDITSGRVYLQELALQMFNKSRLFGIGWDGFKYKYLGSISIDAVMLNVHNVYIQLLTECGIVGALPFYVFFLSNGFKAVQSLVKMVKRPDEEKSILVLRNVMFAVFVELFFLMYCLTGNPLYDEQTLILYIVGCSIVQKPLNVEIYRSDTMRKDEISFGEI
jgi:O-antigen ligase